MSIDMVEEREALWNAKHPDYKNIVVSTKYAYTPTRKIEYTTEEYKQPAEVIAEPEFNRRKTTELIQGNNVEVNSEIQRNNVHNHLEQIEHDVNCSYDLKDSPDFVYFTDEHLIQSDEEEKESSEKEPEDKLEETFATSMKSIEAKTHVKRNRSIFSENTALPSVYHLIRCLLVRSEYTGSGMSKEAENGYTDRESKELAEIIEEIEFNRRKITELIERNEVLEQRKAEIEFNLEIRHAEKVEKIASTKFDGTFPWSDNVDSVLKKIFHLSSFRPLQREAINAIMSGIDTLVVMSTGAGKSLCYQLPAVAMEGLVIVISPLISLIEDQLAALRKLGVEGAALNQATTKEDAKRTEGYITQKNSPLRLLYITPEKIAKSKRLMNKLEKSAEIGTLKAFAIDEVHCCSQWGHDFRPDYKFLNILKRQFPSVPLLGLTATATANVLSDVKNMLDIPDAVVFKAGFNRTNLHYEVLFKPDTDFTDELARVIKKRFPEQSGIVYCFSRKDCEEVAAQLRANGVRAAFYHADMDSARRTSVHENWVSGKYNVIVATVAFGMGIDKPDVRYVIHHALPKSVENYFQESGRAGRDGLPATCVLYFRIADMFRQSTMVCTERTGIRNLYSIVRYATTPGDCRRKHLAEHFEEKWSKELCPKACDVCANPSEITERDITTVVRTMLKLIHEQKSSSSSSNRVTGPKLVELTCKQRVGSKSLVEGVLCYALLNGYLKQDFHFTPYAIHSYMVSGPRAEFAQRTQIVMRCKPTDDNAPKPAKKRKLNEDKECVIVE